MWNYFYPKLLRKLLILGALTCGLSAALLPGVDRAGASRICCDDCYTNYNACLAACGISEKCPELCFETWQTNCLPSCSFC
jgi:hypothetical protein